MDWLYSAVMKPFDWILLPFGSSDPLLPLALVSLFAGVVLLLVFAKFSDQERLRMAKNRIRAHLLELRLYGHDAHLVWAAEKKNRPGESRVPEIAAQAARRDLADLRLDAARPSWMVRTSAAGPWGGGGCLRVRRPAGRGSDANARPCGRPRTPGRDSGFAYPRRRPLRLAGPCCGGRRAPAGLHNWNRTV